MLRRKGLREGANILRISSLRYNKKMEKGANTGFILNKLGRFEEALSAHERSIALDPEYAIPWHNKGIALGRLGRNEEAIRIDPDLSLAWDGRGLALQALGRSIDAEASFAKAGELEAQVDLPPNEA